MARNLDDYEIPPRHAEILRAMSAIPPEDPIPDWLKKQYLLHRVVADRVGMQLIDHDLATIVVLSGAQKDIPAKPAPTVMDLWKKKEIARGSEVLCTWRKKNNVAAILIDVRNQNPVVCLKDDDNAVERILKDTDVYLSPI